MFANITAAPFNRQETMTTLQFAARVRSVDLGMAKTHVEVEGSGIPKIELVPRMRAGTKLEEKYRRPAAGTGR